MSEMTSNVKIYFVMDPWFGMPDMCVGLGHSEGYTLSRLAHEWVVFLS